MAEIQDEKERKELYRLLLNDPATRNNTLKYSFKQWESKMLGDEENFARVADYAVKKSWALDKEDFLYKYAPEKAALAPKVQAPPAPKAQVAPVAPAPVEEEPYVPEPQPLVGSPEYDKQLQKQYEGMTPTLGATFGGVPAAFETKAQKKQEQISPAFKAQQLAFEDVPIAEEQRRAQRQFAKATKEQQQAALRGGTGFEYEQEKKAKERGAEEFSKDFAKSQLAMAKQVGENIFTATKNQILEFSNIGVSPMGEDEPEAQYYQREAARRGQEMYNAAAETEKQFRDELSKRNIKTSVYDAIQKGQWNRVPEAVAYTIGEAAMQMGAFYLTKGGSAYLQTLPQEYKNEVEAIAAETNRTPEQVIAAGDDAPLTAKFSSGLQYAFEKFGMDQISKGIASRGGYRAVRDWMLRKSGNKALARAAGLGFITGTEALTEGTQTGVSQASTLSTSQKPFVAKVNKFFKDPDLIRERAEATTAGAIGGLALGGGGQAIQSAMDRTLFEAPKIGKATQRADYDVVQTDSKITERNKIAQAMESAVEANPEAEGQIRQQYQKRINEAAPTDEEVLSAYESLSVLPETEEKNAIRENLEAYMAEKGIAPQAEAVTAEEVQGPGYQIAYAKTREEIPQEYRGTIVEIERPTTRLGRFGPMERLFAYRVPTETIDITAPEITAPEAVTETAPIEELPPVTEEAPATTGMFEGIEGPPMEEAAPVTPAEEEVVTEEVPTEPIASATEEEKQKSLEDEIESIKAQINSLRSEDGSVPSGKRAEFDRLVNLLTQATANAKRGNSTSVTPIRVMPEDIATQAPAFITDASEKAEAADLIEQAIQSSKTWEEAMRKIRKLGYVFDANDNMLLANYLKDRFNPDAPRIGNNKDSFQAWVNGKTDADLAAPEVVSAAPVEEAAPEVAPEVAPVEPVTETTQAISATKGDEAKKAMIKEIDSQVSEKENELIEKQKQAIQKAKDDLKAINDGDKSVIGDYVKKSGYKLITKEVIAENPKSELIKKSEGKYYNSTGASIQVKTAEQIAIDAASKKANSKPTGSKIGANQYVDAYNAIIKFSQDKITAEEAKDIIEKAGLKIPKAIEQSLKAPEAPAAPAPKGRVEVVFPTAFEATEVKPYAEVEDNYYRPDQQLKFNQGTYEPVRIIAHPDVIRAMSIGSKLRDNNKRKTVTEQEIDFANGVAKRLGFTTESGKGNAIMLHNAARELAKQNRSNTEERFVVIGQEQGGKKKAPAPKAETKQAAPVTPAPAAPKPIEFGKQLEKKYGVRIDLLGKLDKGDLTLSRIEVPQTERGKGIGSKIMEEIIKYADENGKRIALSPTKEFGATSVDRLRKFYKGFGFVENKGSNKDFTIKELMYRLPSPKTETKAIPETQKETGAKESLGKRLKGDALLDAEDTLTELADNGATINPDGTVVVYHRTTKDKADAIVKNNEMFGLEDGVFFSTSEKGQAEGYGDVVVKMNVPIEQIEIDDTFGNEAHVRIPTKKANQKISVSKFSPQITSAEVKPPETKEGKKAEAKEEKVTPTTLSDIRNKFGEVAYGIAKKQQEVIGEEFTDLNRVERTADRIIELGGNDKGVAVAEALMYEIGYPDNFNDLRNAIKKGGIELNSQAVERMLEVGVELPNDILKEFQNSNRYKNASPEVVSIVEKQVGKPTKKAEAKTEIEEPTKKGVRFEKGKKLTEEEKKEVYKNLKDSYKEMKRPYTIETRVSQYTGRDYEARVWLENASDYMQTSDVTGRKLRYYIFLPDGTLAHPTEIFPNISASEMTRVQRNVEYNERQANEKMDDITSQLKKSGEIDKVVKAIETALNNGAEFVKEYDSNDVGQKNPFSVLLRFPNGSKWGIPEYVINTQKSILGFNQQDAIKNKTGESREKIFDTNYQPDWEQFYNNNKQAKAQPSAPSFTSQQSSEAATAFDKAKTSKGFDKKYGKGAYKALSDITKNFEDIMDKVSEKIKQDCIV